MFSAVLGEGFVAREAFYFCPDYIDAPFIAGVELQHHLTVVGPVELLGEGFDA